MATTLAELVDAGVLAERQSPRLGDHSGTAWAEVDGAREDDLRHRLRVSLGVDPYDARTAALLRSIRRTDIAEHALDSAAGLEVRTGYGRFYLDKAVSRDGGPSGPISWCGSWSSP